MNQIKITLENELGINSNNKVVVINDKFTNLISYPSRFSRFSIQFKGKTVEMSSEKSENGNQIVNGS
jgi:hypothetical protein